MKILISTSSFDVAASSALKTAAAAGIEIVPNPFGRRLSENEIGTLLGDDVVGLIAGLEPLSRSVIERAKSLQAISRCGIGMDNVDLEAANERGILVRNTPDAPSVAVAELTLGLMLDLLRHISLTDRRMRSNNWTQTMGRLLAKQVVGLIGYGRIGKKVGKLAQAFGATVIAHDSSFEQGLGGVSPCDLHELLEQSDIVSLHIPYGNETHHLLDAKRLRIMKQGSVIVNCARGGLIDEAALLTSLKSGHTAGVALDCFEEEPYRGPLLGLDQVLVTAHMGSYAKESRLMMEEEAAENVLASLVAKGVISLKSS